MPLSRQEINDYHINYDVDFEKGTLNLHADFISPGRLSDFLQSIHRHDDRFNKAGILGTVNICERLDVRLGLQTGTKLKVCAYQTYIRRFPDLELFEIDAKQKEASPMPHSITLEHTTHYCPQDYRIDWDADLDQMRLSMRAGFISTAPLAEFLNAIHRHDDRFWYLRRFGIGWICKLFHVHLELPGGATFMVRIDPAIRRYPDIALFEVRS